MPGGIPFDDIARQAQGIQLVSTHNQQRANRLAETHAENENVLARRARRRARRYEETNGRGIFRFLSRNRNQ